MLIHGLASDLYQTLVLLVTISTPNSLSFSLFFFYIIMEVGSAHITTFDHQLHFICHSSPNQIISTASARNVGKSSVCTSSSTHHRQHALSTLQPPFFRLASSPFTVLIFPKVYIFLFFTNVWAKHILGTR